MVPNDPGKLTKSVNLIEFHELLRSSGKFIEWHWTPENFVYFLFLLKNVMFLSQYWVGKKKVKQ